MKKMFFFWSLLVLVSGLFASVSAQTDDFPFEMVNYTLENGLEVTIVQDSTAPVVAVDSAISAMAPADTPASTMPGLTSRSTTEPMNRPTIAPPQYIPISLPASCSASPITCGCIR